jgi:hypothetical protein
MYLQGHIHPASLSLSCVSCTLEAPPHALDSCQASWVLGKKVPLLDGASGERMMHGYV